MEKEIQLLKSILERSNNIVFFTGAGVSVAWYSRFPLDGRSI